MYKIVILSVNNENWVAEVAALIKSTLKTILQRDDVLDIQESVPGEEDATPDPVVVIYLGNELAAVDPRIISEVQKAEKLAFSILPIVRNKDKISDVMPSNLQQLNAINWDSMKTEAEITILEMLGIIEKKRRLFLSYKRDETNSLALQLCRALSDRRFDELRNVCGGRRGRITLKQDAWPHRVDTLPAQQDSPNGRCVGT